jgi:hypothetical protein
MPQAFAFGVLHDNRDIGLDYTCIIGSSRYRRGVFQIVKSPAVAVDAMKKLEEKISGTAVVQ